MNLQFFTIYLNGVSQYNSLNKVWQNSQLNTAINCITYGINCLYYDRTTNLLHSCMLSIHEEYINILHIIVDKKFSILFQLQNVKGIGDKDVFVRQTLKAMGYQYFIILYTSALESHVLVMMSENQINVLWEGLQYFVFEGKNFYERISSMDPFKAETSMLFMNADADGSNLLDIDEAMFIFNKLKINKTFAQIEESIKQINDDLYNKENLKKPKDFEVSKLTPLGFQYILQFFSLKSSIAPLFTQFCPIFKFKHKQFKKSILDILKSQSKPLMSSIQFQQFLSKYMKLTKTEPECLQIIKSFPVYDGEGQEIPEQIEYLSFHNFCNYVFSSDNSLMSPVKMKVYQDMDLPLTQYFIYSACMSEPTSNNESLLQVYEIALKKGCRCVQINIFIDKKQDIVVKLSETSKKSILLVDVLKTIKNIAFSFNPYPLILSIQCNVHSSFSARIAKIFQTELGENLFTVLNKQFLDTQVLPSPKDLKHKILLQQVGSSRRIKQQQNNQFMKLITLTPIKLDFQRKGITSWDTCQMPYRDVVKYEEVQDKNLTDYSRKVIVRTTQPEANIIESDSFSTIVMFRNGIQIIAHNTFKEDWNHYLIHSKFFENGGRNCGYLLKPQWMRSNCLESLYASNYVKLAYTVKIRVFAGQKYVLANTDSSSFTLQVCLIGSRIQESKNKKFVSEPKNEGFYSDFELECQFFIYCPEIAMIVFAIIDDKKKILSFRALSVASIREGLRTVQLIGPGMELNLNSCLLIQAVVVEEKAKKKTASLLSSI